MDDEGEDFDEAGGDNEVAEEGKGVMGKIKVMLGGKGKNGKPAEGKLSQRQLEILKKKIEKQKEFLRGDVKKGNVSSSENKSLDTIDQSGTELKTVGQELANGVVITKGIECIVVKKMNQSLLESSDFPLADLRYNSKEGEHQNHVQCASEVLEGIRLGTILGKKLQVRSESRETIFNRQLVGRMDKRMISSLGFGNEHVFFTKEIDAYKKANLHISVDASGSMSGTKWRKTMTNVVALAKAVDMISNLEIQISFRTTSGELPYIVVAYDSRIDKFIKVKTLFQYLRPGGTTPEGLAFEGVMKQMVGSTTDVDSYFLNISDGEPYFHGKGYNYQGYYASKHTKKMVDKIQSMGIKVLSYFVSEYSGDVDATSGSGKVFKDCYGKAASYINVTNVNEVTRTMNGLFMAKES
jgi:nitric oxide reductase activation protein